VGGNSRDRPPGRERAIVLARQIVLAAHHQLAGIVRVVDDTEGVSRSGGKRDAVADAQHRGGDAS
jgi:hypothetical protein